MIMMMMNLALQVMVDIWSAGNYGSAEESSTRLARPLCFLRADATDNGYAHPIEGLRPVVDLNLMQVLRVEDYGVFPLPPASVNYSTAKMGDGFRTDIKPLTISQPEGPSYVLQGNHITWQKFDMVRMYSECVCCHPSTYSEARRSTYGRIGLMTPSFPSLPPSLSPSLSLFRSSASLAEKGS